MVSSYICDIKLLRKQSSDLFFGVEYLTEPLEVFCLNIDMCTNIIFNLQQNIDLSSAYVKFHLQLQVSIRYFVATDGYFSAITKSSRQWYLEFQPLRSLYIPQAQKGRKNQTNSLFPSIILLLNHSCSRFLLRSLRHGYFSSLFI